METIRITTSQNIDIDYDLAGLGERIIGRLIDLALFVVILIGGVSLEIVSNSSRILGMPVFFVTCLAVATFYDLVCESFFNGQSVGKRIMKIKVISLDGARPSLGQYLIRWVFRIVDFLVTFQIGGLIAVVATSKRQRIGDIVAGTILIRTSPRVNSSQVAFLPPEEGYEPVFNEAGQLKSAEIMLIHEVISNVEKSHNFPLLHQTANRFKQHLQVTSPYGMDDLSFLQTLIKDYNYCTVKEEA
jgi:uncharacterized RDD family membrane protein YckC